MWEFELVEKLARLKPDDGFFNDLAVIWFRCDSCEWFIAVRQFHVYFNLHVWGSVEVGGQVTLWCLRGVAGGGAVRLVTNTVVLSVKAETHFISLFMGYNKSFVIRSLPLKQTGILSQNCNRSQCHPARIEHYSWWATDSEWQTPTDGIVLQSLCYCDACCRFWLIKETLCSFFKVISSFWVPTRIGFHVLMLW